MRHIRAEQCDFSGDVVTIGTASELSEQDGRKVYQVLRDFMPWRKGPFNIFGIEVDAEWRSELKWRRLEPYLPNLEDKVIGDIGCNTLLFFLDAIDTCTCMGASDAERQGVVLADPSMADKVIVMGDAVIQQIGTSRDILAPPSDADDEALAGFDDGAFSGADDAGGDAREFPGLLEAADVVAAAVGVVEPAPLGAHGLLAVDPEQAVGHGPRLRSLRSEDAGETWQPTAMNFENEYSVPVTIDPELGRVPAKYATRKTP